MGYGKIIYFYLCYHVTTCDTPQSILNPKGTFFITGMNYKGKYMKHYNTSIFVPLPAHVATPVQKFMNIFTYFPSFGCFSHLLL